tara:strand:- start:2106 stop:3884 length:1779 start_codon:yes stop_codon:yes gene_type:complete
MAKIQKSSGGLGQGGSQSSTSGAYANPQQQTNSQFQNYINKQPSIAQDMDRGLAAIVAKNALERAEQERLFAAQNKEQRTMFDKVAGIKETGYGTFDQNMNDFFDNQTENYFKIKKGIKDRTISQMEGNRHLSYLNQQVSTFKESVVPIMAQAKRLQEALKIPPGEPGAISSRVPTAQQEVLLSLVQGGNVKLVDDNGQLCLFKPGSNGGDDAMINVNELLQLESNGVEYFTTVPDVSESLKGVYDNTVKPGGKDNADLVMFNTKRVGDQEVTTKSMTSEQRQKAATSMVKSNQFRGILDDEDRMKTIWADVMKNDTDWMNFPPNSTAEQIEVLTKKQRDEAALFLANKAIDDNAPADGIEMIVGRKKYKAPGSGKASKTDLTDAAREQRYNSYVNKSGELVGDSDAIATALTEINPLDHTYSVVDDTYITSLMSDDDYEDYNDASDSEKKTMINKAYSTAGYNKGDVVDKDGEKISGLNTAEGIKRALQAEGEITQEQGTIYDNKTREATIAAYKAVNPKPTGDQKTFEHNGRTYKNPVYIGPGSKKPASNNSGSAASTTTQKEFDAAWAKLPPGGKLKGPNGVTYIKPKK